ncbi:hypothetical protein [Streptomyces shaanxiensis]|uniref:WXG100 family type VII secretion target n=1 Tax=Streptomyces shaanxiensis TaxID=653357 RepID=A0ABP7UIF8_9ACTN
MTETAMTYHADVEFLEDCNPALIERNAQEFTRMRDLLDSVEDPVKRAKDGTRWESVHRESYDERLVQVASLVRGLSDGFGKARNALLGYADAVTDAKQHLETGIHHEARLDALVASVATAITRTAQAAEPMRRWEDIRETTGFLDWIAEIGVDADSIREDAEREYSAAEAAFSRARTLEENARRDCLGRLQTAYADLPDFRGGDFKDGQDVIGWIAPMIEEAAQAARMDDDTRLPGGDLRKNPFPGAGDARVSPALQDIRNQLKSLPEGDSLWLLDEFGGRDRWIGDNKELINAAAQQTGLPPDMIAGIAWKEVGGKPYVLDSVTETVREAAEGWASPVVPDNLPGPLAGDRDNTSYGPMAVQIRRAAEVLGYDPDRLSEDQRDEIRGALKDPAQNLFIASKYLANLKAESEFADVPADRMTAAQYRELAARYNGGPYYQGEQAQAYADDFEAHRAEAGRALR